MLVQVALNGVKIIQQQCNLLNPETEVQGGRVFSKHPIKRNRDGTYEVTIETSNAQRCTVKGEGQSISATAQVTVRDKSEKILTDVSEGHVVNVVNSGTEGKCFSNGQLLPVVVIEGTVNTLQVTKVEPASN